MHICLVSADYPPSSMSGIARQRSVLAEGLLRAGHRVSVVCTGEEPVLRFDGGIEILSVMTSRIQHFAAPEYALDALLTVSQALYEGVRDIDRRDPIDVIDVPLWGLQGLITVERARPRTVVWLQTTSAQLLRLERAQPKRGDRARLQMERRMLARAAGIFADSQSVLQEVCADYGLDLRGRLSGVALLGLPDRPLQPRRARSDGEVQALVVGRLERRKGVRELFGLLPRLLRHCPSLRVRFVGADNSAHDGWRATTGRTYPETFTATSPAMANRVRFDGHVTDDVLDEAYANADLVIVPSRYESFGLVYLEAMRAGLPVVAVSAGGAREIFPDGDADGALLVPARDEEGLASAVEQLVRQPELRAALGRRGRERFLRAFTADHMTSAHEALYVRAQSAGQATPRASRIYQVMEALDHGDAVSNIARDHARLLEGLGQPPAILARFQAPGLESQVAPLPTVLCQPASGLIFHYWGHNGSLWLTDAVEGPCVLYYHNITPPSHYPDGASGRNAAERGRRQLREAIDRFALLIGDSRYNLEELTVLLRRPTPAVHIYPVIPLDWASDPDEGRLASLRADGRVNVLFVGRIARNKQQGRVMETFDHYWRTINRHAALWIVGNEQSDADYRRELATLQASLASRASIHFTGKISDRELRAFYQASAAFLCASEHEGFCMPIAQAMVAGVPVIARAAAAVPETMGGAGLLVHDWQIPRVAELVHLAADRAGSLRGRLVAGQRTAAARFSEDEARQRLEAVVRWMQTGEVRAPIDWLAPRSEELEPGEVGMSDTAPVAAGVAQS